MLYILKIGEDIETYFEQWLIGVNNIFDEWGIGGVGKNTQVEKNTLYLVSFSINIPRVINEKDSRRNRK